MTSHPNRGRIALRPLGTIHKFWRQWPGGIPRGFEALAEIEAGGLLLRNLRTGTLVEYAGSVSMSVDQRRAEAALAAMQPAEDHAPTPPAR